MGCPRVGDRLRDVDPQVPAVPVGDLVELGGGQFAPGPLGGPVGRVDEADRGVLDGLGGRVVAQVGGEERVDAGRAHGVEQAVAGAAADGDPADRRVEVARDADALGGGGQPLGGTCGERAERLRRVHLADPAEAVLRYEGAGHAQAEGAGEGVGDAGVGGVGVGVRDVQGDAVPDEGVDDAALEVGGRDGRRPRR